MKPPGSLVSLYYDSPRPVEVGDYIRTPTGRTYRVETLRVQQKGSRAGRKHMMCTVLAPDEEVDGKIHPLVWYTR